MELQPLLHDLLVGIAAPTQVWSARDGQVRSHGAQGTYHGDVRVLSRAELRGSGAEPEPIASGPADAPVVEVLGLARTVDEPGADPTVRVRRTRVVAPGSVTETITIEAATSGEVTAEVELAVGCDLAPMGEVKAGRAAEPRAATVERDTLRWAGAGIEVRLVAEGTVPDLADPTRPVLRWTASAAPGRPWTRSWALTATGAGAVVLPASGEAPWSLPTVTCDDRRLGPLLDRSLADLAGLRMRAAGTPDDEFLAAGAPWFFTLFGRDSIWAARMLLPLGTGLAAGTLRTLAARQGTRVDVATAEQPGKILHEVRAAALDLADGSRIPPVYYGTVDATPLWVCLLHDAWRWGMPAAEVEALLPAMQRALAWMAEHGDADGDGFLEYLDESGTGLANQGWKDSGDSVQWRDGTLAAGPIALCEVQGYAHEAALAGAALLDGFGLQGADRWRDWAARLAARFRQSFWVSEGTGPYPAIALDRDKRAVDSLTSNIGHLLGTGLLTAAEEDLVAARLVSPALDSGHGLRTLAEGSGGYWPLRYHGGTVWAHDTAIAIAGLARSGRAGHAAPLVEGLLAAASEVGFRLPELFSGDRRGSVPTLVPYPAACRPQAWSAASAVVLVSAVLGLEPDAPRGRLVVRPATPSPVGALRVDGLRVAGGELSVAVDAQGQVLASRSAVPLAIRTDRPAAGTDQVRPGGA
ncbi:MAG TPA: glycogen debranching N-terminal domain-containing protein [Actinotalea sp.]|nr:glycogen debranching N-terminal domain-containing protein [Actinotalea sp.]